MQCRSRQMRRQYEKIKKVPNNHGNSLFDQSSPHALCWTPAASNVMPGKQQLAIGI
jgi:hypothetical protein